MLLFGLVLTRTTDIPVLTSAGTNPGHDKPERAPTIVISSPYLAAEAIRMLL
jgi:hypothetical protein